MIEAIVTLLCLMAYYWHREHPDFAFAMPSLGKSDDGLIRRDADLEFRKDLLANYKKGDMEMPEPDPAIGQAALDNIELGEAWLDFSKEQFADQQGRQDRLDEIVTQVVDQQIKSSEQATEWAQEDRQIAQDFLEKYSKQADEDREAGIGYRDELDAMADGIRQTAQETGQRLSQFGQDQMDRYTDTYAPLEDRQAEEAANWDSEARMSQRAAEARAGVLSNAEMQNQMRERDMARMGIDPRSGRYNAIQKSADLSTALQSADQQNKVRRLTEMEAQQLRANAINTGRDVRNSGLNAETAGLSAEQSGNAQAMQATNLGLAATGLGTTNAQLSMGNQGAGYGGLQTGANLGSQGVGTQQTALNQAIANTGIMNTGFGGNMNGNSSGANILSQLYGMDMQAYQADQQAAGAFWSGLGSTAGMLGGAAIMASSKDYKENKRPIDGSALEAINGMPVEAWKYKDGISDGGEHIGPYAEDFQKQTGAGDGKSIPLQDAIGLTMKAIQELGVEVEKLKGGNVIEGEYERVA